MMLLNRAKRIIAFLCKMADNTAFYTAITVWSLAEQLQERQELFTAHPIFFRLRAGEREFYDVFADLTDKT